MTHEFKTKTILCAAFPGTGKTHICKHTKLKATEVEFWQYESQTQYIQDVKALIGEVDFVFLSTEVEGLQLLHNEGLEIFLVYPQKNLRNEYLDRYIERDNPYDFIGTMMKFWDTTIEKLQEQKYCKHFVLEKNQYLNDVLNLFSKPFTQSERIEDI
jgi:hypothetical protein